jgi:3-oxoacyl-[acyl-carrier-protein] synthase II
MASSKRRAVFTGIGILSPIGLDPQSYWDSLSAGRSGIRQVTLFDASALPVRIAGEIPDFDAKSYLDKKERKSLKMMARTIQFAVAAAQAALDDSAIDKAKLDRTRFGVEFGASLIASELAEIGPAAQASVNGQGPVDMAKWGKEGMSTMPPLWMLKYLPNMLACHVAILHDAQGPNNSITESDVASLLAIGEAYRIIARDQADVFLTGSAESKVNPLSMSRLSLFEALSRENDAPEQACRPFDRRRTGSVIGEGGGVLVLEELEHARRRGAHIYAEVVGFAATFDPGRKGPGLARAIRAALTDAGIGPEDIDHINAHGLGSVDGDAWEARGIHEVFGNCRAPVPALAVKSYIGNIGAGGGSSELAASLLALRKGFVPRTLNYEEPDPACPLTVATGMSRPVIRPYVLKISLTQLGQCAALVCRRWE